MLNILQSATDLPVLQYSSKFQTVYFFDFQLDICAIIKMIDGIFLCVM